MVDDLLKENNVRTIWFNAWKYDKEDALWRSMILRILDGLDAKTGDVEDIRRRLYTAISAEELGKMKINWLEAGKSLAKRGIKVAGTIAFPLVKWQCYCQYRKDCSKHEIYRRYFESCNTPNY